MGRYDTIYFKDAGERKAVSHELLNLVAASYPVVQAPCELNGQRYAAAAMGQRYAAAAMGQRYAAAAMGR